MRLISIFRHDKRISQQRSSAAAVEGVDRETGVVEPSTMTFSKGLFLVLAVAGSVGFAWAGVSGLEKLAFVPKAPTPLTVDEIRTAPTLPRWIEIKGGIPRCDFVQRANGHDVVPVIDAAVQDGVSASNAVVMVSLENDELCATLAMPLRVRALHRSEYAMAVIAGLRLEGAELVRDDIFEIDEDVPGTARENVVIPFAFMLACIGWLLWQLRQFTKNRGARLGAVGDVGAAPAGGVHAALASGSSVSGGDSIFPSSPLLLSSRAESQAFRARHVAPVLLGICGLAFGGLGLFGAHGVVNDLRAWYGGVEVPAELKGSNSSKVVLSLLDVQLAWQIPGEERVRTDRRVFMTLWMPDKDAGAVRALKDNPDVVTFEEAVDLVPLRLPLILGALALAFGAFRNARTTRRNADRIRHVAASATEGILLHANVVESRVNGVVTGYALGGTLDGRVVSIALGPEPGPAGLVVAGRDGGVVVAKSADGEAFAPLFVTGEPFFWKAADWARAQAVLAARGSPTRLRDLTD